MKIEEFKGRINVLMAAGIHYNLAISFHAPAVLNGLDYSVKSLPCLNFNIASEIVNSFHYPHHPSSRDTLDKLPISPPEPAILLLKHTLASWPYQMFLSSWRRKTSPLNLLSVYGKAFDETNGFKDDVDPNVANKILDELNHLQAAIDNSDFAYRRVDLRRIENDNPSFVEFKVFYDRSKTSYRQALTSLRNKFQSSNESKHLFNECIRNSILDYRIDLLSLLFLCGNKNLKKTQFLDNRLTLHYIHQFKIEEYFNEKSLTRRLDSLRSKTKIIKNNYSKNHLDSSEFTYDNAKHKLDILHTISHQAILAIEYYSYLISEKEFLSPIYQDLITKYGSKYEALKNCIEKGTQEDENKILYSCLSMEVFEFVKYFQKVCILSNNFRNKLTFKEEESLKVPCQNNTPNLPYSSIYSAHYILKKILKIETPNNMPMQLIGYNPAMYSYFSIENVTTSTYDALNIALKNHNNSLLQFDLTEKESSKEAKITYKTLLGLHYFFEKAFISSKTSMNKILSYYPDEQP